VRLPHLAFSVAQTVLERSVRTEHCVFPTLLGVVLVVLDEGLALLLLLRKHAVSRSSHLRVALCCSTHHLLRVAIQRVSMVTFHFTEDPHFHSLVCRAITCRKDRLVGVFEQGHLSCVLAGAHEAAVSLGMGD